MSGGRGLSSPHMPYNIYILFTYTILTISAYILYDNCLVKWLCTMSVFISAISIYALLVLLLGFIPQGKSMHRIFELLGLNHLKNSWPFIGIEIYAILSLGLVIMRRTLPVTRRNIGFFLSNHGLDEAGISSWFWRLFCRWNYLWKGDYNNLASDEKCLIYSRPFSMKST